MLNKLYSKRNIKPSEMLESKNKKERNHSFQLAI